MLIKAHNNIKSFITGRAFASVCSYKKILMETEELDELVQKKPTELTVFNASYMTAAIPN